LRYNGSFEIAYSSRSERVVTAILYVEPQILEIRHRNRRYEIGVPHVYLKVRTFKIKSGTYRPIGIALYASSRKIRSISSYVAGLPLPNVFYNGHACLGELNVTDMETPRLAARRLAFDFLGSRFNNDVGLPRSSLPEEMQDRFSLYEWQKMTRKIGVDGITRLNWPEEYLMHRR